MPPISPVMIDAVLPLTLRDADRAELLFDSLAQNFSGLRCIWVICPDAQLVELTARYRDRKQPFELRVESELKIVPEFLLRPKLSGWFRQQMIKLAIFERIESDLYLTLDADVICARKVNATQLIADGRGLCRLIPLPKFDYWYERVEAVLRVRAPRKGIMHNVTPALLHRGAMNDMRRAIQEKIARGEYSRGVRSLKQRWLLFKSRMQRLAESKYEPWRVYLMAARPWTEYALYYTFLECNGSFDRYHFYTPHCLYDGETSIWTAVNSQLPIDWDPSPAFIGEGPPWFLVAQSNTGISVEAIRNKVAPLLNAKTVIS
jgi:hypothetical protein